MRNLLFDPNRAFFSFLLVSGMLILLLLPNVSCKQTTDIQQDSLYGRWEIMKAERNGKETDYLRNGYFIISQDGTMTVNITGEDESGKFMLEKSKLIMEGDKTFDIESLSTDSLTVKYDATPNSQFVIYMQKKQPDVQ